MATLAVGTDAGFYLVDETNGKWTIKAQHLEGCEVLGVATEPGGTVLAASRGQGLNRIDPRSGAIERIGGPDMLHAVTVSPHDPRCIYVGTEPAGIHVSRDGGHRFEPLESVARLNKELNWTYPIKTIGTHIRQIVVDAENPNVLYAAVQVGGFIRSNDAGATWAVVDDVIDPDVHAVLQHPTQPDLIYAVCGGGGGESNDPDHKSGRPIYRSRDRGKTWRCVSGDFARTYGAPLGIVPGSRPVLLAGVARGIPPAWRKRPDRADSALMISGDEGDTWQSATDSLGPQPKMIEAVTVSRTGGHQVYLGTGSDQGIPSTGDQITGEIYYASDVRGPWQRTPLRFPGIAVMACV